MRVGAGRMGIFAIQNFTTSVIFQQMTQPRVKKLVAYFTFYQKALSFATRTH